MPKTPRVRVEELREDLLQDSRVSTNYLVLAICACIIATLGLMTGSAAVIIGAMIVAPLMLPLRGVALGALEGDFDLFWHGLWSVAVGALVAIALSAMVAGIADIPESSFGPEILNRTQPNLTDLAIAIVAGVVSGFAKVRPQLSDALAGTAIAVALMPPLCVVGIYLATGNTIASQGAFLLYATNLLGIVLACMVVFALHGYYLDRGRMGRAIAVAAALTGLLVVPLARSLFVLLYQARLQDEIRQILERETVTVGQQAELVSLAVDWNPTPHRVVLEVEAIEPITPVQVWAVEEYLRQRLGKPIKPFVLEFQVTQYQTVVAAPNVQPCAHVARAMQEANAIAAIRVAAFEPLDPAAEPPRRWQPEVVSFDWEADPVAIAVTVRLLDGVQPGDLRRLERNLTRRLDTDANLPATVEVRPAEPLPVAVQP